MDTPPDLKDLVEKVDERLKIVREEERRLQDARSHLTGHRLPSMVEKPPQKRRGRPPKQETTTKRRRRRQAASA